MGHTLIIPVSGPIVVGQKKPTLKFLQEGVGGYVEPVYRRLTPDQVAQFNCNDPELDRVAEVIVKPKDVTWACNEEGKLHGLPVNPRATELMNLGYPIVGTVVLLVGFKL